MWATGPCPSPSCPGSRRRCGRRPPGPSYGMANLVVLGRRSTCLPCSWRRSSPGILACERGGSPPRLAGLLQDRPGFPGRPPARPLEVGVHLPHDLLSVQAWAAPLVGDPPFLGRHPCQRGPPGSPLVTVRREDSTAPPRFPSGWAISTSLPGGFPTSPAPTHTRRTPSSHGPQVLLGASWVRSLGTVGCTA
jgi:hypothetical protein